MDFAHGQSVTRLRARMVADPYSGENTARSWDDPESLVIENAYVAASSSTRNTSATRAQALTDKSLYCQPDADVRLGDRVVAGGLVYEVDGRPSADTNPFSGWQPIAEISLTNAEG
jgi:hypothetical protein